MANSRMTDEQLAQVYGRREIKGIVLFEPGEFGYHCPKGHTAGQITWSEFRDHIWCYVCQQDYHYAEDCYLVRPQWMSDENWERFLSELPTKPQVRYGTVQGWW